VIRNALASRGPYATFWSHLKSIDNALRRTLDEKGVLSLTALDRDRIEELISMLEDAVAPEAKDIGAEPANLFSAEFCKSDYSSAIDFRHIIGSAEAFQTWHRTSKRGFEASVRRLIKAAKQYLENSDRVLFPKDAPREEFVIMRSIIQLLLADADSALQG